jgi:DNA replication licensing factor MCM4
MEVMWRGYVEMRKTGMRGAKKTITATTRQLESIIRLSEAHARMRLSKSVDEADVKEAIRLINVATQRAAMDPRTGTINMDLLTTGHTSDERDTVNVLVGQLRDLLAARPRGYSTTVGQLVKDVAALSDVRFTLHWVHKYFLFIMCLSLWCADGHLVG